MSKYCHVGRVLVALLASNVAWGVTVSPSTVDFGQVQIHQTSAPVRIVVTNSSAQWSERVWGITFSHPAFTRVASTCPWWLKAGASCTMDIVFAPEEAATHADTALVDGSIADQTISLSAQAVAPPVTQFGPKKWNPGHYAQLGVLYNNTSLNRIAAIPEMKGVMLSYHWGNLETAKGVYDFSRIRSDLEFLRIRGKRLVLQISDKAYRLEREDACTPEYMKTDPEYLGGMIKFTTQNMQRPGCIAKRWVPAVMDRLIALHAALGAEFDGEPFIEAIVTEESATTVALTDNATPQTYVDQLKRLASAFASSYPSTLSVLQLNFRTSPNEYELMEHLYRNGIGVGGPDTSPLVVTEFVPELTAAYAGKVPILMAVNATHLTFSSDPIGEGLLTLDQVFDFAVTDPNGINANHLFWWFFEKRWTPGVSYDFYDTLEVIRQRGGYINTTCPENTLCAE